MTYDNALALIMSLLVIGYLIAALLFPEKI